MWKDSKNDTRKKMSSQLYNKVKENIKIANDSEESYLIRSLLREELEKIRNLLNREFDIDTKIWKLQRQEFSNNDEN